MREVWSDDENGYLFGYSTTYRDGEVVFFEQMRMDPDDGYAPSAFNAYPAGQGPVRFERSQFSDVAVTFENPGNDYPQRIVYWGETNALNAEISLIDGSRKRSFRFVPCVSSEGSAEHSSD